MDIRVAAVRSNQLIGSGTCSSIDECWGEDDDSQLIAYREFKERLS